MDKLISFILCIIALYVIITLASAMYAYLENLRSPPEKQKDFHLFGVCLAPLLVLLMILEWFVLIIAGAFLFGILLLLLPFILLMQEPFLVEWIKKAALYLGRKILRFANLLSTFGFTKLFDYDSQQALTHTGRGEHTANTPPRA